MSIQTTVMLSREEAESRYILAQLEDPDSVFHRILGNLTDTELEDGLESDFENFRINPA